MTNYKTIYASESLGEYGEFGIKIEVAATKLPNLDTDAIRTVAYTAQKEITAEVMAAIIAQSTLSAPQAATQRAELVGCFDDLIYVEEIPNGYCNDYCCRHLPWFIVTTTVGRFKIGWRKRVIEIDWTDTRGTDTAEGLFPKENVTKDKRLIHAWGTDEATRYIAKIISSAS